MNIKPKLYSVMVLALITLSGCNSNILSTEYDDFANCLTNSGTKMYGTFWCSYCNSQKDMFGDSWQYIEYIECSLPTGSGQTQICVEAGITGYPTWEFGDGSRKSGVLSFEMLASKTGCSL